MRVRCTHTWIPANERCGIGQPRQGLLFRSTDRFFIPFSIVWGGFAIVWESTVVSWLWRGTGGAESGMILTVFALFGMILVAIGVYFMIGRFFIDAWWRRHTYYAVTDHRILIIWRLFSPRMTSVGLFYLPDVCLRKHGDGTGTIILEAQPRGWLAKTQRDGRDRWFPAGAPPDSMFDHITDAGEVFRVICEARAALVTPAFTKLGGV